MPKIKKCGVKFVYNNSAFKAKSGMESVDFTAFVSFL